MINMQLKSKMAIPCLVLLLYLLIPFQVMAAEVPADGEYLVEMSLSGGSGKARVESPARLTVSNGTMTVTVIWGSPYYTYMLVDGTKYDPVKEQTYSTFLVPIKELGVDIDVQAETIAMSEPHLIDYTLHIDTDLLDVNYMNRPNITTVIIAIVVVVLVFELIRIYRKHRLR